MDNEKRLKENRDKDLAAKQLKAEKLAEAHAEEVECARIWDIARNFWLDNRAHEFPGDNRLMGCVESGCKNDMTPHCWNLLKAQYGK